MKEYVTISSTKRNFGLKGLELFDFAIIFIGFITFLLIITIAEKIIIAFYSLIFFLFLLMPINVSNKNRFYKVILMCIKYFFNKHILVYQKEESEGVINENIQRLNKIKSKIRSNIK